MRKLWLTLTFLTSCILGILVFWIKEKVRLLERESRKIEQAIEEDKEYIQVLKAEWSHLNTPDRLEKLSLKYLDIRPSLASSRHSVVKNQPFLALPSKKIQEEEIIKTNLTQQKEPTKKMNTIAPYKEDSKIKKHKKRALDQFVIQSVLNP